MNTKNKRIRLAAAIVLAALSVVGVSEASAIPGAAGAGPRVWCC